MATGAQYDATKGEVMGRLNGKVAVVTGGNSGIGLATAKRFVEEGAHVVITGRREKELKEAAALIGRNVTTVTGDITRLEDLDRLYAVVKEKHGHIDVLFANAGWGEVAPIGAATEAHFDKTFDLNAKGTFFTVQKAIPLFKDGGSIILNTSVSNVMGLPTFAVYAASKAAVRSFARGWAMELKDRKIRVNAVSPGPIETPALEKAGIPPELVEQAIAGFTSQVPLGRRGKPEEIAAAVVFLASEESSYITGVELAVDGGMAQV
jgi:NAD(P)-dependent dehydrogenase (short-subunit alcohol dehydrogenase family)